MVIAREGLWVANDTAQVFSGLGNNPSGNNPRIRKSLPSLKVRKPFNRKFLIRGLVRVEKLGIFLLL